MTRKFIRFAALAAFVGVAACEDALVVDNPNAGNKDKVLGSPGDAENLIGSYYKRWHEGVYGGGVEGRLNVWSFQNFSSLANNCQNTSYPFGSSNINNTPGNPCGGEHFAQYSTLGEVNRVASDFIGKLDATGADKLDLGSLARNNRARAFAEMLRGMSLGYQALIYDSIAVVHAGQDEKDPGQLVLYLEALDSAYAALDRAILLAEDPASNDPVIGGLNGFPFPENWIPTGATRTWNSTEFVRLIKSYRARIRANMARTPQEREDISNGGMTDWQEVINDAAEGFQSDFQIFTGTGGFGNIQWRSQYNAFATWHQMPPFIIGMADQSGSYSDWLAQPLGDRGSTGGFFMTTPDLRFPQGATRGTQQSDVTLASCNTAASRCKRYFYNRPTADDQLSGQGWGFSNYGYVRFRSWAQTGDNGLRREGKTVVFTLAELDLLRAEGHYRLGQFGLAGPLINNTRTRGMLCQNGSTPGGTNCTAAQAVAWGGGLPALVAFDATTPVPGGAACVPKVPAAPAFNAASCGNMWEALKWEKRMEAGFTHWLSWYLDSRGWGDLARGTPLFLPVPFQDWLARGKAQADIYHTGEGIGSAQNSAQATIGTYGW